MRARSSRGRSDELALGGRLETALEGSPARVPAHDLRIMVTAILVQRRTGGNLARALAGLADRLEERGQLARELRGVTAQARMTAWLVAALPLAGGAHGRDRRARDARPRARAGARAVPARRLARRSTARRAVIRRIGRVEP